MVVQKEVPGYNEDYLALSMEENGFSKIALFKLKGMDLTRINANGKSLEDVLEDEHITDVKLICPITGDDPAEDWIKTYGKNLSSNGLKYSIIKEGSPQDEELKSYGVRTYTWSVL